MTKALKAIGEVHRGVRQLAIAVAHMSGRLAPPVGQPDIELLKSILDYMERHVEPNGPAKEQNCLHRAVRRRGREANDLIDEFERETAARPPLLKELRERLASLDSANSAAVGTFCALLDSYAKRMQQCIEREENVLFPFARNTLEETDWQEIGAALGNDQAAREELGALMMRLTGVAPAPPQPDVFRLPETPLECHSDLLEIRQLCSHYGRIEALHSVSLSVRKGRLVALVGANGAGKTTLLRTISGVQKASSGSIHFEGRDITRLRPDKRVRLGICQVPEGRQVFAPLSVADNLRLGAFTG
ncbi:MAG TPA: ATP-binding cassette domain-containing protein, partial [Burkholderiaceae bacterium]|nr:ATP-binding cassette domain-containing protein [Burkholderiaceae bacterium]